MMTREELRDALDGLVDNGASDLMGGFDCGYDEKTKAAILAAFDSLRAELDRVTAGLPKTADGYGYLPDTLVWMETIDGRERVKYHADEAGDDYDWNSRCAYRFHPETGLTPEGEPRPNGDA